MGIIQNTLEQGLIYAIMALGVLITYSILDFPDLSVDGTFPLGAAVSALMITRGQSPALALLCAGECFFYIANRLSYFSLLDRPVVGKRLNCEKSA